MASSTPSCATYSGRIGTPPWSQRPPPLRKSTSTTALGGGWRGARGKSTRSSSAGKAFAPPPRTIAAAKSQQKQAFVDKAATSISPSWTVWDDNYLKTERKRYKDEATGTYWVEQADGLFRVHEDKDPNPKKTTKERPRTTAAAAFVDMSMHVDVLKPCDTIHTLKRAHDERAAVIASRGGDPRRTATNSEVAAKWGWTEHSKHFRDFTPEERASAVSLAPAVEERRRKVKEAHREADARRAQIAQEEAFLWEQMRENTVQQQEALLWKQLQSDVAEQFKNSLQDSCGPSQPSRTLIRSASEPRCGNNKIFTGADAAGLLRGQTVTATDLLKFPGLVTATGSCPPTIAPDPTDMIHAYKKEAGDLEWRESGHRGYVSINSADDAVTSEGSFGLGLGFGMGGRAGCELASVHKKMDGARTPPSIVPQIKAMFAACKQTAFDDTVAASEGGASTRSGSSNATSGSTSSNSSGGEHKQADAARCAWRGASSRPKRNQSAGATRTSAYQLSRLVNLASLGRSTQGGPSLSHRRTSDTPTKSPTTRSQTPGGSARRSESTNSRGGPHGAAYMSLPVRGVGGIAMR